MPLPSNTNVALVSATTNATNIALDLSPEVLIIAFSLMLLSVLLGATCIGCRSLAIKVGQRDTDLVRFDSRRSELGQEAFPLPDLNALPNSTNTSSREDITAWGKREEAVVLFYKTLGHINKAAEKSVDFCVAVWDVIKGLF